LIHMLDDDELGINQRARVHTHECECGERAAVRLTQM